MVVDVETEMMKRKCKYSLLYLKRLRIKNYIFTNNDIYTYISFLKIENKAVHKSSCSDSYQGNARHA